MIKWFIQLVLIGAFIGSNIYIYDSSLSFFNIFIFLSNFYILANSGKLFKINFLIVVGILLLFIIIGLLYLFLYYRNFEQIKDLIYSTYIITLFILVYLGVSENRDAFLKLFLNSFVLLYWIIFFIVIAEYVTGWHLSISNSNINTNENIPTAFFANYNDLATAVMIFMPLLYYLADYYSFRVYKFIIIFITSTVVIITLSRMAFLLLLSFPLFLLLQKRKYFLFISSIFLLLTLGFILLQQDIIYQPESPTFYNRTYNKIVSVIKYKVELQANSSSVSQRFEIYNMVFKKPENYFFGNGFRSGEIILKQNDKILVTDPHSFFIETIFNFGYFGLIPILAVILGPLIISLRYFNRNELFRFAFVQTIYFILLINVPSSIYRFPLVWIPIAFLYSLLVIPNKNPLIANRQNITLTTFDDSKITNSNQTMSQ